MNELQKTILDIYKSVYKLCKKHNIRFYAIGGTALGAVRHNGFIPWDDDLDIGIPIEQYNYFFELCKKELPKHLVIFDYHKSKHCLIYWNKISDARTTFLEKNTIQWPDYHYGVFIDVMPICGVPPIPYLKKYNKMVFKYHLLNHLRQNSFSQMRLRRYAFYKLLLMPINIFIKRTFWLEKLDKYQSKYLFDDSTLVGCTWLPLSEKYIFKREWFNDIVEIKFEDTFMPCCSGYDEMLKTQFGNYLELPPEKDRVSNHYVEIVDLKEPFINYSTKSKKKIL